MTKTRFFLAPLAAAALLSLAACTSEAPAGAGAALPGMPKGNIAAGEQLANAKGAATGQSCIDCHGADGNAPIDASYPRLGGQFGDYLAYALRAYRDGTRDHALMSMQAQGLSDQQVADISVYFASRDSQLRSLQGAHN
ncbi:cytochrome c [Lysobacter sp. GX 14042]|uniref:c-type cytochrome n=1 Tax=Lysobacter sp. GX 14042 TaxID=2907155 RepID=UPI0031BBC146